MTLRRHSKFQDQTEKKTRIETITKLFSTTAMTVAAVVVVSVFVPTSPTATLEDVVVFEDRMSYRVNIVDPDQAIQNDSLKVRLSNQLERYETLLTFGYTLGSFTSLTENTTYLLEVLANKGFGEERLASERFTTRPRDGGAIMDVRSLIQLDMYSRSFEVDVAYYNDNATYSRFLLEYASTYEYEFETSSSSSSEPQPIYYTQVELTSSPSTIAIQDVPHYHTTLWLRLIGVRNIIDFTVLDAIEIPMPFSLAADVYLDHIGVRSIALVVYPDSRLPDAVYRATLWRGPQEIGTEIMTMATEAHYEQEMMIGSASFNLLAPATLYEIAVRATYTDPNTMRQEMVTLDTFEVTTLGTYTFDFDYSETDLMYEATVTLVDPSHNFQQFYYEVWLPDGDYPIIVGQAGFLSPEDKTSTLYIQKPDFPSYDIVFGVRSQTDMRRYDEIYTLIV